MKAADIIGWISSVVLVITLFVQVRKQWAERTSRGVSPFLFIGQLAASIGFFVYSLQIESWVFVVTNALAALAALCGLWITWRHRDGGARNQGMSTRMEVV